MRFVVRKKLLILLMVGLLLFLTACSNNSQSTSSSNNPSSTTSQTPPSSGQDKGDSKDPVKIGVILSFTGPFAPLAESIRDGIELYFDEIGRNIDGRPIEMKYEDDEGNPQVALRKYRQLVHQEGVDLLMGPISTAVVLALRDQIEKDKIVLINTNAASNEISWDKKSDYIFRVSVSNWQYAHPHGKYMAENVGLKAVTLGPDYPAGHEVIEAFKASYEKAGTVVKQLWPPLGTTDFATYLTDVANTETDIVFAFMTGTDGIKFATQYKEFGLKDRIALTGTPDFGDPLMMEPTGDATEDVVSLVHYTASLDNPVNNNFVKAFTAKYNYTPNYFNVYGYDGAQVVEKAVKQTGGTDSEQLIEAIKDMEIESPRGKLIMDSKTNNVIQNFYPVKNVKKDGKLVPEVLGVVEAVTMPENPPTE